MAMAPEKAGIGIRRHFTIAGTDPYDEVKWDMRDARITNYRDGSVAFEQRDVEVPASWTQNATNILAQKYFRGSLGSPERERSLRQVTDRVVDTITRWGRKDGYFVDDEEAEAFQSELKHLIIHQKAAFNSPVWFNIGVTGEPQQASACQPWHALVSTAEGLVPIGALVEGGAVGAKVFDAQGLTSVVAVKANGTKTVLRVHTSAGYLLDVTADHVVWRARGAGGEFVPAGRLGRGDELEWHHTESWGVGEITRQAVAEAALAGWVQAGGFVTGAGAEMAAEVTAASDAEQRWVEDAVADAAAGRRTPAASMPAPAGTATAYTPGRRLRLEGPAVAPFVKRWGLARTGADTAVPERLFTAPLPVAAAYLRSLFQAEGWLSWAGSVVGLAMASDQVVRGVQSLLLRFGIFCRVRRVSERRPGGNDFWVLNVSVATDGRRFADEIGFVEPARSAELDAALAQLSSSGSPTMRRVEVERIEVLGEMPVFDIQTESGEYLSGNLRVHNCFILAVEDTMRSILNWYVEEGTIFKGGSGAGINLSSIRSSQETLKGGGAASGPVSFMRGADASAGTIKCLHAGTAIPTDHGVIPIAAAQPGWKVLTRHGERRIEAVHDNGVRPLVRLRTALGDEILCTPEHRFWVRGRDGEQWREAGDLRPDDYLVLDLSAPYAGSPQRLDHPAGAATGLPTQVDERFALWLGWLYGDGSVSTTGKAKLVTLSVDSGDPEEEARLADRYRDLTRAVFGREVRFSDTPGSVRFSSGPVIAFLEENGLRMGAPAEARVPQAVASSPAPVRAAFLSGLFEAEGHVANGYPMLSTVSHGLALDVHRLLLSLGIPSTVGRVDDRFAAFGTREIHTVRVLSGEGVLRFAKLVGFVSERKSKALEEAVERKNASLYETKWFIPHIAAEFAALWDSADGDLARALAPYCRYRELRGLSMLRARVLLDRFPKELAAAPFARFAAGEEMYVTASVEPAGDGPTFDLTVEGVHEYLVDHLVTHNSGGKTRRAAKMVILNADHPDVEHFIWCKAVEERKARVLRDAGFDMDLDGHDSHSTQYQNANNSVRVTDEFMRAVVEDRDWHLRAVTTGDSLRTMRARDLFRQIAEAAWECADPGMQFDTTINRWHTASNTGRINGSNPCSEYMHLDNSACNLASINLLKFLGGDDRFDVEGFKQAVEVVFTAQEILVGNADYPTERIAETSRRFRQLGLGYANLGALLMALGMPYDSDEGRAWAGSITALMTGHAYATSARIASRMGAFAGYSQNAEPTSRVLQMHRDASLDIDEQLVPVELVSSAQESWEAAVELCEWFGVRNAQASVLAPTGCLVGGSLIATDRGLVRLQSLGDPNGARWQDLDVAVGTDEGPRRATKFYVNGAEAVVTATTHRGYRIQGTPTHRVKVVDPSTSEWAWRRFAELRPGDLVPLALDQLIGEPRHVPLPPLVEHDVSAPSEMTPALAELIGYFMGGGSLHSRGLRLSVAKGDFDVVEHLERLGKEAFGIAARVTPKRGHDEVAFRSMGLASWWEACGFAKRWQPHIPDAVLHANDREVYRAFIRGLFEANGTVTTGFPSWSTTCEPFAADVQSLLLALGFPTTRRLDNVVHLNLSSGERWLEEIGFMGGRKSAAVHNAAVHNAAVHNAAVHNAAAHNAAAHTEDVRHDHIPLTRAMVDRLAPAEARGSVSRRAAADLYERSHDPELGHLLGFFYDRIETAELGADELTYDLSVPENVTYVANGFVSHNTIGLLMDCDTTGIEPDLGLCKTKKLVGGGTMSIVNQTVPRALRRLGYRAEQVTEIVAYIDENKSIVGAPHLRAEHLPVFACSMGDNVIHYLGHVKMMGAVQPFISGAISKTINMPEEATVDEIEQLHIEAWQLGLKAVAIYRDNCKVAQPLSTTKKAGAEAAAMVAPAESLVSQVVAREPVRKKLPRTRNSKTFSFRVADCHGYVTVGEYDDGRPGEIFLKVAKQGSTLAGIMDAFAISVSHGLQYGVPLKAFIDMYTNMRFEPAGMTDDPDIRFASSLVDYIFRRLAVEYLGIEERIELGILTVGERMQPTLPGVEESSTPTSTGSDVVPDPARVVAVAPPAAPAAAPVAAAPQAATSDAPYCYQCGMVMQRAGACFVCSSCGTTSGCS